MGWLNGILCRYSKPVAKERGVEDRFYKLLSDDYGVQMQDVSGETNFVLNLNFDSILVVDLVTALENEFDIKIPDEDVGKLMTVGAAVDYIKGRINQEQQT
jgi:acyl carrier protein